MTSHRMMEIEEAFGWEDDYDVILALVHLTYEKLDAEIHEDDLSESERIALYINWFDAEVANGGLDQFYFNDSGNYAIEMLETMKTIGAVNTARLLEKSFSIFPSSSPSRDRVERQAQFTASGEEGLELLYSLTGEYYDQEEYIFTLGVKYLQGRKSDFM